MRKIRIFLGTPGVVSLLFKYACLVLSDELVNFITCRKDKIVDRCTNSNIRSIKFAYDDGNMMSYRMAP